MAGYTVSSVTAGKYARQISVAASGPQGAQGPTGSTGATGAAGAPGGLSAQYKFINSYSAGNPGNGYFAFNNLSIFSATQIFISEYDINIDSQSGLLDVAVISTSVNTSVITIQSATDTRKFSRYYINGASIAAGWRTLDLEYIEGTALSWSYNDPISILVTPIGDRGQIGPTGAQGPAGPGVPAGGTDGQVLKKVGSGNYDTEWVDPSIDESAVSNLVDVELTNLGSSQVLVYDTVTSRWVNRSTTDVPVSASQISGTIIGGSASTF
tara:strand:- start:39 stop:842 length:804 start_codon:yes stop_codon:yes gene_type:complete